VHLEAVESPALPDVKPGGNIFLAQPLQGPRWPTFGSTL